MHNATVMCLLLRTALSCKRYVQYKKHEITMNKFPVLLFALTIFQYGPIIAQSQSEFLPEKPGKWSFSCNKPGVSALELEFNKNQAIVAEWFHKNVSMLNKPAGFDLRAVAYGIWDDHYMKSQANYGIRSEMTFMFQLFLADLSNGGKWTVEPPSYSFNINDTESGHHSRGNFPYFDELKDDPAKEKAINAAAAKINGIIAIFQYQRQLAPGVDVYQESADGDRCHIIVYNPERPPYWLPLTVKEVADIYLEYYSLHQKQEIDRMMLEQLKSEIAELSAEELAAPACQGHDSHFALPVNGRNQGPKLARFNPDYWDKSMPPSAIQFMTFWYPQMTENQMKEYHKNNGHPNYSQLLVNQVNWSNVAGLISNLN
jgi:hypothetical protein